MLFYQLLFQFSSFSFCLGANILVTYTAFTESRRKSLLPIAEALGKRGHNVTVWNVSAQKYKSTGSNFTNLDSSVNLNVQWINDFVVHGNATEIFKQMNRQPEPWLGHQFPMYYLIDAEICREAYLQHPDHLDQLRATKWDLMIGDSLTNICGNWFAISEKVPYISISSSIFYTPAMVMRNMPVSFASFPTLEVANYDHLMFYWRTVSVVHAWIRTYYQYFWAERIVKRIMRDVDPSVDQLSLRQFEADAPIAIAVSPQILDFPKVHSPDIFYADVACSKNTSLNPLTSDMLKFLEDSDSMGTIIAAFGHWFQWSALPENILPAFLGAFRRLPQYRFVLQYNGDPKNIKDLASNTWVSKWVPQKELLAHNKTKAFVTHCGMKSTLEAICSRTPLITLPMYYDQPRNALALTRHLKVGLNVPKMTVTAESLAETILEVVTNSKFQNKINKLVDMIEDAIIDPSDELTFLFEHAIKHYHEYSKTVELKSKKMSLIRYYSLDSISFLLGTGAVLLYVSMWTITLTLKMIAGKLRNVLWTAGN